MLCCDDVGLCLYLFVVDYGDWLGFVVVVVDYEELLCDVWFVGGGIVVYEF